MRITRKTTTTLLVALVALVAAAGFVGWKLIVDAEAMHTTVTAVEAWVVPDAVPDTTTGTLSLKWTTTAGGPYQTSYANIYDASQFQYFTADPFYVEPGLVTNGPTTSSVLVHGYNAALNNYNSWIWPSSSTTETYWSAAQQGSNAYVQEGGALVAHNVSSGATSSSGLSELTDDAAAMPSVAKGRSATAGAGTATAYAVKGTTLYAFTATGAAAGVKNVSTGAFAQLAGSGTVGSASAGGDGKLYATTWRCYDAAYTIKVVRIDPATLAVLGTYDTGLAAENVVNTTVIPTATGIVVMVAKSQTEDSDTLQQYVWRADGTGLTAVASLPANTGNAMGPGSGNTVLLFGGPAVNIVSRLNLQTGALTVDVPELRAPAGAYVMAAQDGPVPSL